MKGNISKSKGSFQPHYKFVLGKEILSPKPPPILTKRKLQKFLANSPNSSGQASLHGIWPGLFCANEMGWRIRHIELPCRPSALHININQYKKICLAAELKAAYPPNGEKGHRYHLHSRQNRQTGEKGSRQSVATCESWFYEVGSMAIVKKALRHLKRSPNLGWVCLNVLTIQHMADKAKRGISTIEQNWPNNGPPRTRPETSITLKTWFDTNLLPNMGFRETDAPKHFVATLGCEINISTHD